MKKLSFFLSALIAFGGGNALAQSYVNETTDTGVTEALNSLGNAGTMDVFVLNPTDIASIEAAQGITANIYKGDENITWGNGGNVGGADWSNGMESWANLGGKADSNVTVCQIYGDWWHWWAGEYLNNNANRNLAHINPNTHIHAAFWVNSGALCGSNTNIHFLRRSDATADTSLDAQFVLNSNIDANSNVLILGTFVQNKWVAVDITLGQLEKLLVEKGYQLDYNRFSQNATINHIIGFEPSASGQDKANGGNPAETCGHNAKFAIDAVYLYTPETTLSAETVDAVIDTESAPSDYYYATYSNNYSDVELQAAAGATLKVYNVAVESGVLKLTQRADNNVARGEAVLVKTDAATFTASPLNACTLAPAAENQLVASPALDVTVTCGDDYKLYRLTYNNYNSKEALGFYYGNAEGNQITSIPNKAYLKVPVEQAASLKGFRLNPQPTHVEGIEIEDASQLKEPVYDLSGRRVENPTTGFYLQGNKKIIVK